MTRHPLSYLPRPISYFLGYRAIAPTAVIASPPPSASRKALALTIALIFAFAGLSVVQSVFHYDKAFTDPHLPGLITSYGASAILVYGLPSSPLAQPRALIGGHFVSALTGIIVSKLFQLLPAERFDEMNWLGGSLATAVALVVMDVSGTTHPPAGATAILPVVQADIRELGWELLWIVLLSSVLLMGVGCVGNNIIGRWPVFWFSKDALPWIKGRMESGKREDGKVGEVVETGRMERRESARGSRSDTDVELEGS